MPFLDSYINGFIQYVLVCFRFLFFYCVSEIHVSSINVLSHVSIVHFFFLPNSFSLYEYMTIHYPFFDCWIFYVFLKPAYYE